jgi:hypothetical protein
MGIIDGYEWVITENGVFNGLIQIFFWGYK